MQKIDFSDGKTFSARCLNSQKRVINISFHILILDYRNRN